MVLRSLLLFSLVVFFAGAGDAKAWSAKGHRLIAELAERQLSPKARANVQALLAADSFKHLSDIASWADELRGDPTRAALGRATAPMHYVNHADAGCTYRAERDCPQGRCVVMAIERYSAILADRKSSSAERAEALRFVVHFVGDVHQPLHAGYRNDKGGNTYQVQIKGKGSNLHTIWDRDVLASRGLDWPQHADALAAAPRLAASGSAKDWAEQSCRLSRDGGVYPAKRRIDDAYLKRELPVAERQVRLAAARLAALLNRSLG